MCFNELCAIVLIWELLYAPASLTSLVVCGLACERFSPTLHFVSYLSVPSPAHPLEAEIHMGLFQVPKPLFRIKSVACKHVQEGLEPEPSGHVTWWQGSGPCRLHLQEATSISPLQGLLPLAPWPPAQLESRTFCLPPCTTPTLPLQELPPLGAAATGTNT